jgi:hypothetical protein
MNSGSLSRSRSGATFIAVLSLVALMGGAPVVHAATLSGIQGGILVNRGTGFEPAIGAIELPEGTTIIANPGASATLNYDATCAVSVVPGGVTMVAAKAPCAPGQKSASTTTPPKPVLGQSVGQASSQAVLGQPVGQAAGQGLPQGSSIPPSNGQVAPPTDGGLSMQTLAIGGIVAGGLIGSVVSVTNSNNRPNQPNTTNGPGSVLTPTPGIGLPRASP